MKVGDKVMLKYDIGEFKTEITATAYDETGVKVYTVKGSTKDYYEDELELLPDEEKLYGNNYQLRYEELKKKYDGLVALNRATLEEYEEQEKIIELMNEYILKNCVSLEICSKQIGKECYIDVIYGDECKECVLDYFRKKAKEMK